MIEDEESDIDERLRGHVRYTAALFDLCTREASIRQAIDAERAVQNQLQRDAMLLKVGLGDAALFCLRWCGYKHAQLLEGQPIRLCSSSSFSVITG